MAHAENSLKQLEAAGQAVWLDYIRRHLLTSAEFRRMLDEDGLKGMTSNPTIFEKAIAGSTDYDVQERIQGSLDIPLNEQGISEAAQTAEQLRDQGIETVYAGNFVGPCAFMGLCIKFPTSYFGHLTGHFK